MRKFEILWSVIFVYLCVSSDRETQRYRTPSDAGQISGSGCWQSSRCNSIANLPRKAAVTAGDRDTEDHNECGNMRWLRVVSDTDTAPGPGSRWILLSRRTLGPETGRIKTWDNKHFMRLVISYLPPTTMTQIRHWERVKRLNASNYRWLLPWPESGWHSLCPTEKLNVRILLFLFPIVPGDWLQESGWSQDNTSMILSRVYFYPKLSRMLPSLPLSCGQKWVVHGKMSPTQ